MIHTSGKTYLRIVDGNLVQKVDEGTEHAKLRKWKNPEGQEGSTWELVYMNWTGHIKGLLFKNADYGTVCNVDLGDAVISFNTSGRYFSDFASKLCGADLSKEFLIHPYSMEVDGKKKTGVSLQQNNEKLGNYFYDFESKQTLHGFPVVDEAQKEKLKKNYWKVFFAEVEAFLIEKLGVLKFPTAENAVKEVFGEEVKSDPVSELPIEGPSDLPF